MSAAAALAVLDVIEDERVLDRVQRTGRALRAALDELRGRDPAIGDVRGVGLAWASNSCRPRDREPDGRARRRSATGCASSACWSAPPAPDGNVLKIRPPLALTEEHVPTLAEAFATAVSDTR